MAIEYRKEGDSWLQVELGDDGVFHFVPPSWVCKGVPCISEEIYLSSLLLPICVCLAVFGEDR